MVEYREHYGLTDEEIASYPTVYRVGLFAGEVALVSGAATGIGRGIAALFARLGAKLVVCGRNAERLEEAATFFRGFGGEVLAQPMTIRDPEQVDTLMTRTWETFGRLDHLINNAGGQFAKDAIDISYNGWKAVIDTNLNGTWLMMQGAARRWRDAGQPGSIVTITADVRRGIPQMAHTTASRAGVNHLTKVLAIEWAPYRIRLNCVAPGVIESSGFNNYSEDGRSSFWRSGPMKRTGHVMDIAEACVYLSSHAGNFVTGETLTVAGGMSLLGEIWPAGKPAYFAED